MNVKTIVWADDEIDLLKPYVIFLSQKGYNVLTSNNGVDAVELVKSSQPDIVFLDEQMPGMSGIETLQEIRLFDATLPIVMITKSEEEDIMETAIGQKITDYLIKPVNPSQILLCLKKHIHERTIMEQQTNAAYREEMPDISYMIQTASTMEEWQALQRTLTYWEMRLQEANPAMLEMLRMQRQEANLAFLKYIRGTYAHLLEQRAPSESHPLGGDQLLSPDVFKRKVFPLLDKGEKVCVVVIDNFRYDQWKAIQPLLSEFFTVEEESLYTSILPTATQYARNALFAGLMPLQIQQMYPQYWIEEGDEETKNNYEQQLLQAQLDRYRRKESFTYFKINESDFCEKVTAKLRSVKTPLNVVVLNFIDMLSHSRTDSKMMRELMADEAAYRAITLSWFRHSPTYVLLQRMAELGYKVVLTTDHGTVQVHNAVSIVADKNTNTNLRYKVGKALVCKGKDTFLMENPKQFGLPCPNLSSTYFFASGGDFFSYPNNFNYYGQYYADTFQHGGVSLEEMIIPLVTLSSRAI